MVLYVNVWYTIPEPSQSKNLTWKQKLYSEKLDMKSDRNNYDKKVFHEKTVLLQITSPLQDTHMLDLI
jgi:hypothetical protein